MPLMPPELLAWLPWLSPMRLVLILSMVLVVLMLVDRVRPRRRRAAPTTLGSAAWATKAEVQEEGAFNATGMVLGEAFGKILRSPFEQNVVIFGPAGEGKTVTNVLTTLTSCDDASLLVLDMSGELVAKTAPYRAPLGSVYVLDLNDPDSPDACNPLDLVRWDTDYAFEDCQRLASHIVKPRGTQASSGAEHYERVATAIIPLAILYGHESGTFSTFAGMLDYFSDPSRTVEQALRAMGGMPHPTLQRGVGRLTKQVLNQLRHDWTAAAEWLTLWEGPILARNTSRTTIPWAAMQHGARPMTVYLRIASGDAHGRLRPVVRMLLDQVLFQLTNRPPTTHVRELILVLDDVGELGYFGILEDIAAFKRKWGLRLMLPFQSPSQVWHEQGRFAGVLNSCGCWVIYRQNDPDSARYLAEKLGERTVEAPADRVSSKGWLTRPTRTVGESVYRRDLLSAGEILSLRRDEVIVCIRGSKVRAKRINAYRRQPFAGRLS
jgi:type IV secretion system protein VirD4